MFISIEGRAKARSLLKNTVSYTKRQYLTRVIAKVRDHSPILEVAKQLKENEVPKIFFSPRT